MSARRKILFLSIGALACHFVALGVHSTVSMLAFSRQQVFHLRVLNLNDIIRNLLKMLQRIIEIHTDLARDLKPVKADPGQLEQILMNLSVNARDAMPQGGRLTLETRNVVLDENFVREHVGSSPGPQALLTVSDTGTGMDNATLSRIFEPFFTTKEPGRGTGLGLAMVYGVVKQSGGSIWVSSKVGSGTSLQIYLPQAQGVPEALVSTKPQTTLRQGSVTILLVKDDAGVRELVSMMTEFERIQDFDGRKPERCRTHLQDHCGKHSSSADGYDPSGGDRARDCEARGGHVSRRQSAVMSGYTDDALIRSHGLDESFAFLQKPFSKGSVAAKVREVLDSDGFTAPSV
jgi:two-component system, cell cycle sensor histidine kinase and response regulator CckA